MSTAVKIYSGRKFQPDYLRQMRQNARLSQGELANAAGLTGACVGMLEKGQRQPMASTLAKLAMALGVSLEDFFDDADIPY